MDEGYRINFPTQVIDDVRVTERAVLEREEQGQIRYLPCLG